VGPISFDDLKAEDILPGFSCRVEELCAFI
jgi:hypothetical protein